MLRAVGAVQPQPLPLLRALSACFSSAAAAPAAHLRPTTYMRALPPGCVAWASPAGQARCAEALLAGTMECHYLLAPHFRTQSEPIACGQSTLAMALNALQAQQAQAPAAGGEPAAPPYDERGLDCCLPQEEVQTRGITLGALACMARCRGYGAALTRVAPLPDVGPSTPAAEALAARQLAALRVALCAAVSAPPGGGGGGAVLVAAYSREALGQTGALGRAAVGVHSGHYSPLGGYHAPSDSALIMDVARFKYAPHWVPLAELFRAMRFADPETRLPRGYLRLSASPLTLALQGALGGAAAGGSILAALFGRSGGAGAGAEAAAVEAAAAAAAAAAGEAEAAAGEGGAPRSGGGGGGGARQCGGQGRLAGAALALLRRVDSGSAAGGSAAGIGAWIGALRLQWEKEEAAVAEAEYEVHAHPSWGGAPLAGAQAALAGAALRSLEGTALFAAVQGALAGSGGGGGGGGGACAPPRALGSSGFAVTPAHRLALLLALGLAGQGGSGARALLAGLPAGLRQEAAALWGGSGRQEEERSACGGCGTCAAGEEEAA
jgi:glutathione gamma-glutamylcysteinyltransferase